MNRRRFLQSILVAAASQASLRSHAGTVNRTATFGRLTADPRRILDLPNGFSYRIVSRSGDEMDDGMLVPANADGMAAFAGADGNIVLVCNHENVPVPRGPGPYGITLERMSRLAPELIYDRGANKTPGTGGTTTIVFDPRSGRTVHRHLSLAGTELNCAGGPTPWGSWLSCEEAFTGPGLSFSGWSPVRREQRHGYVFEVPASERQARVPVPLRDMGRFEHEAAAVDPASGIVYMTEDRHRSLLYRFIPRHRGQLHKGGRLQALAIRGQPSFDTRNWDSPATLVSGRWQPTRWIDLDDVDSEVNDLRFRGFAAGAARFARGEGMCVAGRDIVFTCTIGGPDRLGQVFRYRPGGKSGTARENDEPGQLQLLAQSTEDSLLRHADNLTMAPWGDLVICEDTAFHCGLVGIGPDGQQYPLADNPYSASELAGVCFSPDGAIMFVNVQYEGLTLAVTGPWPSA